jgi:putative sporulation protein YyaC
MAKMFKKLIKDFFVPEQRIDIHQSNAPTYLATAVANNLTKFDSSGQHPIIAFCIGTDRSTGDSLGPLIGTLLSKKLHPNLLVFGTLDEPVHAINLKQFIAKVEEEFPLSPVIAIDACLGRLENVGYVTVGCGSLEPGAGVKKDLPPIGDIYIKGVVNVGGFMEYLVLQNTRLSLVVKMANVIAEGLHKAVCTTGFKHRNLSPQTY